VRRRNGIAWEELEPETLPPFGPALASGLHRGVLLPGNGHTVDPHALVVRLAEAFVRNGGKLVAARAVGFDIEAGRLRSVRTSGGAVAAGAAGLAAGAHAGPLARMLGDRLPLETERGYHLTLRSPEVVPRLPAQAAEDRFVATPMAAGLRLTGVVELAGLTAPPDWRRARNLLVLARRLYPGPGCDGGEKRATVWMSHRPSLPNSLPVIGYVRHTRDVIYAVEHGHLGLTGAPFTGRLVAELVGGRLSPPPISPPSRLPASESVRPERTVESRGQR